MTSVVPEPSAAPLTRESAIADLDAQLSLLWRRARAINHQLTRSVHPDLEPAAYGLLSILLRQGAMRLTELAKHIGVGKPSLSRQITFLAELGLVQRISDERDGRAQLIELTAAGRAKMQAIHRGRQDAFHHRLKDWEAADVAALSVLLARLNNEYHRD